MANIISENIKVFPVSTNRLSDTTSRLLYEHNIANIIRQLSDAKNGFIIAGPDVFSTEQSLGTDLELCIYGYYIKILSTATITLENSHNYVLAKLDLTAIKVNDNDIIYQLDGQDDAAGIDESNFFQPLSITSYDEADFKTLSSKNFIETNETSKDKSVYLPLFKKDSTTQQYKLYTDSLHKFNSSSINIVRINGKR